jgi:prepilin-type processing-associated H-X9-DG protein
MPAYQAYGGYGHNYAYLCYDIYADPHVKLGAVTKPVTCCMNADALDPAPGLQAWNYGYLYPPSEKPDGSTGGPYGYTRHDKGANYCWADGHVALTSWRIMTNGQSGFIDWFYMPTPTSKEEAF